MIHAVFFAGGGVCHGWPWLHRACFACLLSLLAVLAATLGQAAFNFSFRVHLGSLASLTSPWSALPRFHGCMCVICSRPYAAAMPHLCRAVASALAPSIVMRCWLAPLQLLSCANLGCCESMLRTMCRHCWPMSRKVLPRRSYLPCGPRPSPAGRASQTNVCVYVCEHACV